MRTLLCFLVLAAFAAGIAVADTNITGKWTGSFTFKWAGRRSPRIDCRLDAEAER